MLGKLKLYGALAFAAIALFSAVWMWFHPRETVVTGPVQWRDVTKFVTVKPHVECKEGSVTVVNPIVSENARTAPQDAQEPILATGDVPASEGGFELKTTLSPSTGEAKIQALPKPRPFFGFENEGEIGVLYGVGHAERINWTFARAGSVYFQAGALSATSAVGQTVYVLGGGFVYRW